MNELSSYAYGLLGWFYPFIRWAEWYSYQQYSRQAMVTGFIVNSFIFGIAVLLAGMVRKFVKNLSK